MQPNENVEKGGKKFSKYTSFIEKFDKIFVLIRHCKKLNAPKSKNRKFMFKRKLTLIGSEFRKLQDKRWALSLVFLITFLFLSGFFSAGNMEGRAGLCL